MKVFVSYARKNPVHLERCEEILAPFVQDKRIELWVDKRNIEPGDDWHRVITDGLKSSDAAVLLITPAFMGSKFIKEVEIPALLGKLHNHDAGKLIPVFLEPANVDIHQIEYTNRQGNRQAIKLNKIQGIGAPGKELNQLNKADRSTRWAELGKQIEKQLERRPEPTILPNTDKTNLSDKSLPILDVHLQIREEKLHRSYGSSNQNLPPAPWDEWRQRLLPITSWQKKQDEQTLSEHAVNWGETLFTLLFGDGDEQKSLFTQLNDNRTIASKPTFQPYQVRIHTTESALIDLPWQLCDWQTKLRCNGSWQFTSAERDSMAPVTLRLPFRTLILVTEQVALEDERVRHLASELNDLFAIPPDDPDRLLGIVSMDQNNWRQQATDRELTLLVYLDTGGASAERLGQFVEALERSRQQVPFLAAIGTEQLAGALRLLKPFAGLLSVEHATNTNQLLTAQWLHHCLADQLNPLKAWNDILHPLVRKIPNAASLQLHARKTDWTLGYARTVLEDDLWRIFDRFSLKKALTGELVSATQPGNHQRVLAVCPFGLPGDQAGLFSDQLRGHIQNRALPNIPLVTLGPIGLPTEAHKNLGTRLTDHLLTHLPGCDTEQEIKSYLHNCISPAKREQARRKECKPILWLYWGAFGDSPGLISGLTARQLTAWLNYCSATLAHLCPLDTLIVSVLSVESSTPKSMKKLAGLLENTQKNPALFTEHFSLLEPKPLERINVTHIYELFREHPGMFQGSDILLREVAAAIVKKSAGEFQKAVTRLNRGHLIGWEQLLKEIGIKTATEDEDDFDL
ncbi:MAG: toll/interleukin-1 receptor domain-containing protein [Sedimenticola sp.]